LLKPLGATSASLTPTWVPTSSTSCKEERRELMTENC
jgi:hypothetical protein